MTIFLIASGLSMYAQSILNASEGYVTETILSDYSNLSVFDVNGFNLYAKANWGSTWRLPTFEEINELVDCCVCGWMADGLIHGINVVGPNGNSIFFPAAGYRNATFLKYPNE